MPKYNYYLPKQGTGGDTDISNTYTVTRENAALDCKMMQMLAAYVSATKKKEQTESYNVANICYYLDTISKSGFFLKTSWMHNYARLER
jgi:hydroxypyruvate isomerase